jgi:hypothetical protein
MIPKRDKENLICVEVFSSVADSDSLGSALKVVSNEK